MTELTHTKLIDHLLTIHGAKGISDVELPNDPEMGNVPLLKAEVFLLPKDEGVYPTSYRPFGLRGSLLDDTRAMTIRALAYAVGKQNPADSSHVTSYAPISYVFDAEGITKRKYNLQSVDESHAHIPEGARGEVIGTIELPTTLARGWEKNGSSQDYASFPVCEADMFLVNDKLIPARDWVSLPEKERTQHMAAERGLV